MIRRMRRTKPAITRGHGSRRPCNASDTLTGHGERGNYALFPEKSESVRINYDPWNAVRLWKRPYFFLFVFGIEGLLIGFGCSATGGSRNILSPYQRSFHIRRWCVCCILPILRTSSILFPHDPITSGGGTCQWEFFVAWFWWVIEECSPFWW